MYRKMFFGFALVACSILFAANVARAQKEDAPKLEIGPLFTSLSINPPEFPGTDNQAGFGGRVTYNVTDNVALEAEGSFFPGKSFTTFNTGGRAVQTQFGVKAGKRFGKFGVFAKARPGFVSFGEVFTYTGISRGNFGGVEFPLLEGEPQRKTHFSTDIGGVLEFYPSRKIVTRFDLGDTIIHYGSHRDFPNTFVPGVTPFEFIDSPSHTKHNFQFTASVGFRFMDGGDAGAGDNHDAGGGKTGEGTPRYELGAQFTTLFLRPPSNLFGPFFFDEQSVETQPGVGARFTYNINDNFALEAEGNFFPTRSFANATTGGYPFQGQFGAKVGKRFEKFGVFAKARPGFVGFTQVRQLDGTTSFTFEGQQFIVPQFRYGHKEYFSTDVGGVLEFYPSRRLVTRFDMGDTIIRYGRRDEQGIFLSQQLIELPAKTKHNFQFSAGFGFRF